MKDKHIAVLIANTLANMGQGLVIPITTLYISHDLHKSLTMAGFVLMCWALAMMLGNYLGGRMFDEWKQMPTYYIGGIVTILAGIALTAWPIWPIYAIALAFYGLGLGILISGINGYLAHLQKTDTGIFNDAYWMRNIGFAFSTGLSGTLYAINVRLVTTVTTLLIVAALAMIAWKFKEVARDPKQEQEAREYHLFSEDGHTLYSILSVCLALFITWLGYQQWSSNMSVYMVKIGIPVQSYSLLFTISTCEIVFFQPLVAKAFRNTYRNEKWRIVLGVILYAVAYIPIIMGSSYPPCVQGLTFQPVGEMLLLTTVPAYLNRFANDENRATLQSLNNIATSFASAVGPILGSWLILAFDYKMTFVIIFVVHLITLPFLLVLRQKRAKRGRIN